MLCTCWCWCSMLSLLMACTWDSPLLDNKYPLRYWCRVLVASHGFSLKLSSCCLYVLVFLSVVLCGMSSMLSCDNSPWLLKHLRFCVEAMIPFIARCKTSFSKFRFSKWSRANVPLLNVASANWASANWSSLNLASATVASANLALSNLASWAYLAVASLSSSSSDLATFDLGILGLRSWQGARGTKGCQVLEPTQQHEENRPLEAKFSEGTIYR